MASVESESKDHLDEGEKPSALHESGHGSTPRSLFGRVRSWVSEEVFGGKHAHVDEDEALEELHKRIREEGNEYAAWLEPVWEDKLRRVLRAREYDLDAAFVMWHNLAKWRAEYRPDQLTEADAHFYLSHKIFYPVGPDKDGRPGTYVHGKMHVADVDRIEEMVKAIVYLFERDSNESLRTADGKVTVMIDAGGAGLRNVDARLFVGKKGFVHVVQDYYPETLKRCFIINGNWVFKLMYKIVAPFLTEKTRRKIVVVGELEELLDFFDFEALPPPIQEMMNENQKTQHKP